MQGAVRIAVTMFLLATTFCSAYHNNAKLRRSGVLSLYPHPRVGRGFHNTWDVPLNQRYMDQYTEMDPDPISKRQLYAFPRVGRSDPRSNLAFFFDRDQPASPFLRHGRDSEDMEMPVRRTDSPGMWFGPRLGRGFKSEDDEIERNVQMDPEMKENENMPRSKTDRDPL